MKTIILIFLLISVFFGCSLKPKIVDLGGGKYSLENYYEIVSQTQYNTGNDSINAKVEGVVIEGVHKSIINYCLIILNDNKLLANTDSLGRFEALLPEGEYKLKFLSAGCSTLIIYPIILKKNTVTKLNIELGTNWIECY